VTIHAPDGLSCGWRGVVCDVKEMAADADLEEQLECIVRCYTALSRAGTVFNFLHAKRLMKLWGPDIMPSPPPAFETEREAIPVVRTRCATSV
jgi:hypothetical protein